MNILRRTRFLSLLYLFSLILLNGIGTTISIPNLIQIAEHYDFPLIGFVEALFVVISTLFLFIWGYFVDKLERKRILWVANSIWIFPAMTIFLFPEFLFVYIFGRMGMAAGLSAFSPLAYSILADYAKYEDRGLTSSGLNIAWVGSSAAGILVGGFFSYNWSLSFGFIGILGIIILCWQFFFQDPKRGNQEPAFENIIEFQYPWRIEIKQLPEALKSRTILWLLIQGVFALIPGTIFTLWLVSFLSSTEGINVEIQVASVIAIIIASGRAVGYPFFGRLGDYYIKKHNEPRVRSKIASICMASQFFFFLFAFLSIDSSFFIFSILFWFGSFIGAASGPNRTSLLFDVSLPEHRGSLGALFSLTDQLGEVIGIVLSTILLLSYGFNEVFIMALLFYLLAAFAWALTLPHINNEKLKFQNLLDQRASIISSMKIEENLGI